MYSDLGLLHRHPILLELYTNEFTPLVKAQHGSVENYLRESLGPWKEVLPSSEFCWKNGMECKVKLNDWGYALPLNVSYASLSFFSPSHKALSFSTCTTR